MGVAISHSNSPQGKEALHALVLNHALCSSVTSLRAIQTLQSCAVSFLVYSFDMPPCVLSYFPTDYFRGKEVSEYNLAGLDRVVVCTAHNSKLHFRHYAIMLKQSGSKVCVLWGHCSLTVWQIPRVELDQVGPIMDFTVRRRVSAAPEVVKAAMRRPKIPSQPRKRKNIESGQFGDRYLMLKIHCDCLTMVCVAGWVVSTCKSKI